MEISKIMSLHENFSQVECEDGKNIEATENSVIELFFMPTHIDQHI